MFGDVPGDALIWETFKEEAKKISPRWSFKKTQRGFEIWEKAFLIGPGQSAHYAIQIIPHTVRPTHWLPYLRKLRQMDYDRRRNLQTQRIKEMQDHNKRISEEKEKRAVETTKQFYMDNRHLFKREADELNISETAIRLKMKGVLWDDTKKRVRQEYESKGAYG